MWAPPSGYLEVGETLEEAAARELFEETGVSVNPMALELHGLINMPGLEQVAVSFRMELDSEPQIRVGRECLEVALLAEHELPLDLAWRNSIKDLLGNLFSEMRRRAFTIGVINVDSVRGTGQQSKRYCIRTDDAAVE
jgi:ADP-ribose pyrophosphatase YjhB (NUDIX family)